MKVVTHNIKHTLDLEGTKISVNRALRNRPQIVAFQEFDPNDVAALTRHGSVVDLDKPHTLRTPRGKPYLICVGNAKGLPVLLRDRYVDHIVSIHSDLIVKRVKGLRPTPATFVRFVNRHGMEISVMNTHPMAHHDIPKNKAAFESARSFINNWGQRELRSGWTPIILMDGNGLREVYGLTSCWEGNQKLPTGPGGNTIDMIFTDRRADSVDTFGTPSDHNGVIARYKRFD